MIDYKRRDDKLRVSGNEINSRVEAAQGFPPHASPGVFRFTFHLVSVSGVFALVGVNLSAVSTVSHNRRTCSHGCSPTLPSPPLPSLPSLTPTHSPTTRAPTPRSYPSTTKQSPRLHWRCYMVPVAPICCVLTHDLTHNALSTPDKHVSLL